jgi:hypothetical protein
LSIAPATGAAFDLEVNGDESTVSSSGWLSTARVGTVDVPILLPATTYAVSGVRVELTTTQISCKEVHVHWTFVNSGAATTVSAGFASDLLLGGSDSPSIAWLSGNRGTYFPSVGLYVLSSGAMAEFTSGSTGSWEDVEEQMWGNNKGVSGDSFGAGWENLAIGAGETLVFTAVFTFGAPPPPPAGAPPASENATLPESLPETPTPTPSPTAVATPNPSPGETPPGIPAAPVSVDGSDSAGSESVPGVAGSSQGGAPAGAGKGMTGGATAGIVLGVLAALAAAAVCVWWWFFYKKRDKVAEEEGKFEATAQDEEVPTQDEEASANEDQAPPPEAPEAPAAPSGPHRPQPLPALPPEKEEEHPEGEAVPAGEPEPAAEPTAPAETQYVAPKEEAEEGQERADGDEAVAPKRKKKKEDEEDGKGPTLWIQPEIEITCVRGARVNTPVPLKEQMWKRQDFQARFEPVNSQLTLTENRGTIEAGAEAFPFTLVYEPTNNDPIETLLVAEIGALVVRTPIKAIPQRRRRRAEGGQ